MKRIALSLLALALSWPVYAQNPIPTSCVNNVDNNGNICTVVNTYGGKYDPYNGWSYPETNEDGKAFPPNNNSTLSAPAGYYFNLGLAFDPLLEEGGPLQWTCGNLEPCWVYGYVSSILSSQGLQGVLSTSSTACTPRVNCPRQIGAIMGSLTYTFGNLTTQEANYTYVWTGTWTMYYRCFNIGRYGCDSRPAEGLAMLSAFPK